MGLKVVLEPFYVCKLFKVRLFVERCMNKERDHLFPLFISITNMNAS